MRHRIVVGAGMNWTVLMWCRCGEEPLHRFPGMPTLDEMTKVAHEHIEASESDPGYGTKSAVTSEDALIDISTGHRRT